MGQHLFLNIIPNNFTARTGRKVWCDRGISLKDPDPDLLPALPNAVPSHAPILLPSSEMRALCEIQRKDFDLPLQELEL